MSPLFPDAADDPSRGRAPARDNPVTSASPSARVGAAKERWHVPTGLMMDGYSARRTPNAGQHDPLWIRALALDDGSRRAVIVTIDVIGLDLTLTQSIRASLQRDLGLEPDLVLVAATHTHSGPGGIRTGAHPHDELLRTALVTRAVHTAAIAVERLEPATVAYGHSNVEGLSQNRRDPNNHTPTRLDALVAHSAAHRQPLAVLCGFACHPTVLDHENLQYSADYPGAVISTAEAALPGTTVLFLTGACADVNPARQRASFSEVERFGHVLGGAVVRLAGELAALDAPRLVDNLMWDERLPVRQAAGKVLGLSLQGHRRPLSLPLKSFEAAEAYAERIAAVRAAVERLTDPEKRSERRLRTAQLTALGAEEASRPVATQYRERNGEQVTTELQYLGFDADSGLLAFPGETFSTYDGFAREHCAGDLMVAAYANDYVGYLVPATCLAEGGYEAGRTLFDATQQATLEEAIRGLLPSTGPEAGSTAKRQE